MSEESRLQRLGSHLGSKPMTRPDARGRAETGEPEKRVAVMQPYFFPYAGYFRLFAAVDEFVIFDCVQFPRRGRVHRTQVPGPNGGIEWLTLPLAHQPKEIRIGDLRFAPDARTRFDQRLKRLPWVFSATGKNADRIRSLLFSPLHSVADYLEAALRMVVDMLGFSVVIARSSHLNLDPALKGQARVVAVAKAVGATHYINAPGGRALYQPDAFVRNGITLSFLSPYEGRFFQLLPALMKNDPREIRDDVQATAQLIRS